MVTRLWWMSLEIEQLERETEEGQSEWKRSFERGKCEAIALGAVQQPNLAEDSITALDTFFSTGAYLIYRICIFIFSVLKT